jgi:hypothetical protein
MGLEVKRALLVLVLILRAAVAFAQGGSINIRATDPATGAVVNLGDASNNAVRVSLIASSPTLTVSGTIVVSNLPSSVATNSGNTNASTLRVVIATDQPSLTNALKVDGSAVTQPISNASLTTLAGIAVPLTTLSSGSEKGVVQLALEKNSASSNAGGDGNYGSVIADASGRLWVNGSSVTQPVSMATNTPVGSVAHDGVGTGVNPLLVGGYASAAAPTDVSADGDAVRAWLLRSGAQVVQPTFAGVLATTGNGVSGTGVQRVTIASDSTGQITANAGTNLNTSALALDTSVNGLLLSQGSTTSGQKGPLAQAAVTTGNPSYTTAQTSPLSIDTTGGLRVHITASDVSSAGGTSAADGAGYTAGSTSGTPMMIARDDTSPGVLAEDKVGIARGSTRRELYTQLRDAAGNERGANVTASNELLVNCSNCSGSGASIVDRGTFTLGTTSLAPTGGIFDDTPPTDLTTGMAGVFRLTPKRSLHVNFRNQAGTEIGTSANPIQVTGANGSFPISGNLTGNQAVNVAQVAGTNTVTGGVAGTLAVGGTTAHDGAAAAVNPLLMGAFASAAAPTDVSADTDAVRLWALRSGAMVSQPSFAGTLQSAGNGTAATAARVTLASDSTGQITLATGANVIGSLSANQSMNLAQVGGTNTVTGGASGLLAVAGNVASGASDSANPLKVGGVFNTTQPTVTNGQRVDFQATSRGAQIVSTGADTFNVTVNAALPTGGNTIGAVTQASGPWTSNVTQVASTTAIQGDVNNLASAAGALDVAPIARYNATLPTLTDTRYNLFQVGSRGGLNVNILDANGTTGAGVTATGLKVDVGGAGALTATASALDVNLKSSGLSNLSTNVAQFGGTNISTGTGASGAGIPRVTVSNDSSLIATQSTAANLKTEIWGTAKGATAAAAPTVASIDANHAGLEVAAYQIGGWSVTESGSKTNNNAAPGATNIGTLPGVATAAAPSYTEGNQVALSMDLTGALRVSGSSGGGVAQTQVRNALNTWTDVGYYSGNAQAPVQDAYVMMLLQQLIAIDQKAGYVRGTFGRPVTSTADALNVYQINQGDPCQGANKGNAAISQTATARLVTGMEGKRIFVCYARFVAGAAEIVSLTEGTGTTCGTGTKAVSGSTTAANGESYAANGGASAGTGLGTIAVTANPGADLCLAQSGSQRVSGNITFVYQ